MRTFKDYYAILQVHPKAKPSVIKAAWRQLAREYHPDVYKESDAHQRMVELNEAYEVLGKPSSRASYDLECASREARTRQQAADSQAKAGGPTASPSAPSEAQRKREEEQRAADARARAEAQRKREEEQRAADERARAEAQRKQEEEQRAADARARAEAQRKWEEEQRAAEARARDDAQRKQEEEQRAAEARARAEAQRKQEEEQRAAEARARAEAQRRREEEQNRWEEARSRRKLEAAKRAEEALAKDSIHQYPSWVRNESLFHIAVVGTILLCLITSYYWGGYQYTRYVGIVLWGSGVLVTVAVLCEPFYDALKYGLSLRAKNSLYICSSLISPS